VSGGGPQAFPSVVPYANGQEFEWIDGMTYHQWLVGQALSGTAAVQDYTSRQAVEIAIEMADVTVATLDSRERAEKVNKP
jgi:hypothetical protein